MKYHGGKALLVIASFLPLAAAWACGPYFPVSYFPREGNSEFMPSAMTVASNSTVKCFDAYRVTPHLGTELAMIGAHYYPAWTGKQPQGNRISTAKADELDFFAAGKEAGATETQVEEDWKRFGAFNESVCRRLEAGEKVELPPGVPDYAMEFYLYKLGHAEWLVFRRDEDPASFGKLLALPKDRRRYRTVWVHFVRIANARRFCDKDRHLDEFRKALDAGFKDTAGLESFVLRFLNKTCGSRYEPLVLTAYAQAKWEDWPGFAKRIMTGRLPSGTFKRNWIDRLCEDPIGIEVAIAYGAGGELPPTAVRPDKSALGADRQAWIAFNRGDFVLCRKLLAMAPGRSLIRLFLEARLARLDGKCEESGRLLHIWLDEYRKRGRRADEDICGYGIAAWDEDYWSAGHGDWFWDSPSYWGSYGPADCNCYCRKVPTSSTHEPSLPRVVAGELGVVMVATRDLEEALYAFTLAKNWIDIAFVAERCMTVDELVKFMRGSRVAPDYVESLRGLLMRRLVRCRRLDEALQWAPPKLKDLCAEYCSLWRETHNANGDADDRAVAFFNLSRLTLTRGMELMGTELRPDMTIYDGDYADDTFPLAEPSDLTARLGRGGASSRWSGWKSSEKRERDRFHYRRKAIEYAKAAVGQAKDNDVLAWSLVLGGVASLSLHDAKTADWFYKRLYNLHHPRARIEEAWFTLSPVYLWFREEHYNEERHRELRVPPRFSKEQLKRLEMP